MHLTNPADNCPDFAALRMPVREEIRRWMWAFESIGVQRPIRESLCKIAAAVGVKYPAARRKYDRLKAAGGHWSALLDNRRIVTESAAPARQRTADPEFRNFLGELAEEYKRKSAPAIKALIRAWMAREVIPGYEDFPNHPAIPEGWTKGNLERIIKKTCDARHLASIRVGTSSKTKAGQMLPQVFSTRVGLWPGAVIQLDDMWHDNMVTVGRDKRLTRVLELGALDLYSGCRFHWGTKPRMPKEDGSGLEGIKEREMRFFLAAILWNYGYSPHGTTFMAEHGTAAIRQQIADIMSDATGGLIRVERQPIEGKQRALTGYWKGSEGGNFRAKAALESVGNLIHNELSHLYLQTGSYSSGIAAPQTDKLQMEYIARIVRDVIKLRPDRLEMLRPPALDYHTQFIPFLNDFYEYGLNGRTDHDLEGWPSLGFQTTEYTAIPGSGQFLTSEQFLELPKESQAIIRAASQENPLAWTNKRNLSPREIWRPAVPNLIRPPAHVICDILSVDLAREQRVDGSYIRFHDLDIAPEELIYEARVRTAYGAWRELPHGEKFLVFANPFAPKELFVCDASKTCIGVARLAKRITAIDTAARIIEAGHKHARTAAIQQPLRIRHAAEVAESRALRDHNDRVKKGQPITDEEIAEARSESGRKGNRTAATNRMNNAGDAEDWDHYVVRPAVAPSAFDSLEADDEIPDAF